MTRTATTNRNTVTVGLPMQILVATLVTIIALGLLTYFDDRGSYGLDSQDSGSATVEVVDGMTWIKLLEGGWVVDTDVAVFDEGE